MPKLTTQERMEKHYGFMCAALNGLVTSPEQYSSVSNDSSAASKARYIASAALDEFEKRWEGERV